MGALTALAVALAGCGSGDAAPPLDCPDGARGGLCLRHSTPALPAVDGAPFDAPGADGGATASDGGAPAGDGGAPAGDGGPSDGAVDGSADAG